MAVEHFLTEVAGSLGHSRALPTYNGRLALAAVLQHLQLGREHEVFITTTFDYPNVSSCVTSTVFNFCKPARVLTGETRAILVIHEFGVVHPGTPALRNEALRRGIPLIEDCAHTIASRAPEGWRVGEHADWAIVSLPKVMPVPGGGLLVGQPVPYAPTSRQQEVAISSAEIAASWWPLRTEHAERRRLVYRALTSRFHNLGLAPLFEVNENTTPWFFPVPIPQLEDVMASSHRHGVDCGLWHGTDIVVFPCHEFLNDAQLDRIATAVAEGMVGHHDRSDVAE